MILGIHHLAISSGDLERSLRFYRDLLRFEVVFETDWAGVDKMDRIMDLKQSSGKLVMLKAGNAFIELYEYRKPTPRSSDPSRPVCDHGLTHICLNVTDVDAEYERLKAAGMNFHAPPQLFDEGRIKTTYGRDPDGNVVEIQEILDPEHAIALKT